MIKYKERIEAESPKQISNQKVKKLERFVRLDSNLLRYGIHHLSASAIKILYLAIARFLNTDSNPEYGGKIEIPLKELRELVPSLVNEGYKNHIFGELIRGFKMPTSKFIHEENSPEEFSWFTDISGKETIQFTFNPIISEQVIDPEYPVRYARIEINRLQSRYAIKIFQVLQGIQNRQVNRNNLTRKTFSIPQLKFFLGIPRYKKLDLRTIQSLIREINNQTYLQVLEVIHHPESGEVKSLEFVFTNRSVKSPSNKSDSGNNNTGGGASEEASEPNQDESEESKEDRDNLLMSLTPTQRQAYDTFVSFDVDKEIVLQSIIPVISTKEFIGFENFFAEELIRYFQEKIVEDTEDDFAEWCLEKNTLEPSGVVWKSTLKKLAAFKESSEKKNLTIDVPKENRT